MRNPNQTPNPRLQRTPLREPLSRRPLGGLTLALVFLQASLAVATLVAAVQPSSTSLTVSPSSVLVGQPATLIATVTGAGPVPTGIVDFRAVCPPPCAAPSPPPFASVPLDATGRAATTITLSETGVHFFTATYNGDASLNVVLKKLPEKNARQGFFETGDFLKILAHLPDPLDDMARFAFVTGWRRGMLLGMKWAHVDRAGRVVTLPDSKNDDPQSVPLDDELVDVIERRWKTREYRTREGAIGVSEYVFHRNGQPISKPTFNRQFAEARKQAGVPGKLFHDLRRTAARNMIRGGVPQSIAKRVTGHRSDSMFQRYDIASMDDKLEAIQKARAHAATRAAVGDNVTAFPSGTVNATDTQAENERISEAIWLGGRDSNPDSLVQSQLSYH
jgi:integrase